MKTKNIFLTVALALSTTFAFAQISGSAHDFNLWAFNGGGEASLCDACHTPHQAKAITDAPLWNHTASTVVTYTNYDSPTMDATTASPSGTSLLCLSCHDGTTALDSYGTETPTTMAISTGKVGNAAALGSLTSSLASEHPISFLYADGGTGLVAEATVGALGLLAGSDIVTDLGGSVECSSCHDVHAQGAGTYALLRLDNANSALCTTCHVK